MVKEKLNTERIAIFCKKCYNKREATVEVRHTVVWQKDEVETWQKK